MKNRLIVLLVVAMMALAVVPMSAQSGNIFTFGSEGNPVQLDPAVVTDGISFRVINQGCEGLLTFEGSSTSPQPLLATDWTASEDGLTWSFNLVEGATFHDGTPFNAEAVKWNFDRWRFTDHPSHYAEQTFEYYNYMFGGFDDDSFISSVEVTGEYQVTFTLSAPNGAFLNNLAMSMFAVASPAAIEAAGADYGTPGVGFSCTGPYKFVEWISDDRVVLERNADYWGEIPGNVDTIVFQIIPDSAARFAALQSGQIDAFEGINVVDIPAVEGSDEMYIEMRGPLNVMYLAFSYRIAEFRNPLVRQAISMAFDRQAIVDAFFPEGAIPAATMVPPSLWGYNPDIAVTPYDPEGARALLAEAGYPDGFSEVTVLGMAEDGVTVTDEVVGTIEVDLFFQPVSRPYNPDGEGIGEAMVSFLQDIGIQANLASAGDWSTYLARRSEGDLLGMYQLGWTGDNGDPDNFLGYFYLNNPVATEGFYANAEVGQLLRDARVATSQEVREPIYQQVEAIQNEETARIYIAHSGVPIALRSRVSGYITNPLANEFFKFVSVE